MPGARSANGFKSLGELHLRLPLEDYRWLKEESDLYAVPMSTLARRFIRQARLQAQGKEPFARLTREREREGGT